MAELNYINQRIINLERRKIQMPTKYCYTDSKKICDKNCSAFNPDGFIIVRTPMFDKSRVNPEWIWVSKKAFRAAMCKAGGFAIEYFDELETDEDEKATLPEGSP